MLIKRVVVQGFKTFASKTEFVFDPGITAIVGPNGSGKSNVVDAVRWCLGEQSYSLIRSKKTSDVIFSGSDKKARLGMAQVSLTLDNSLNELPIDFAEVEITRRAYRDGDNEYLINGQRVRLSDVTELLSHTGLGKRTYAVIGQGLIDKVLSLSPEERRSLFEEAAGITAYQAKRARALRQLEATKQNLTRVYDIIAELSPRLNYLRRQAARARERQQIADDLHDMLRQWYGYRWHKTLRELEVSQKSEQALHRVAQKRQAALEEVGQSIEHLREQGAALREYLAQLHAESSGLHQQAESVRRDLAVSQERLRQTRERREELQRELVPLRLEEETLDQRLQELETILAQASAIHSERQEAVLEVQSQLSLRQQEQKRLHDALDAARRQLTDVLNRQADRQSRVTQTQEQRQSLRDEEAKLKETTRTAAADVATISQELAAATAEMSQAEARSQKLRVEIAALEETVEALQVQFNASEEHRTQAARELSQLETRHDVLARLRSEGAGYASGVRAVLQEAERSASSGILGTVASLIKVPHTFDKAIETALGGSFQNVVTQRWDGAREAIDMLKRTGRGRATFLPLDRLNVPPRIEAPALLGILGNAADLVEYEPRVEQVVRALLGRVWVAEDLKVARHALDALRRGPTPTVVTLTGEIVRPGGAVTGGRDGNRRDDSILAREREFRELPKQIEAAGQKVEKAVGGVNGLSAQIETARARVEESQSALDDLLQQERHQREQIEAIRRRLDRAEQTERWYAERLQQISADGARLAEQEARYLEELRALQQRQRDIEDALSKVEIDAESADISELLQQLADLRTAAAEAQGNLRSQQTLQVNQQRSRQSLKAQIQSKQERIIALDEEAERLRTLSQSLTDQEEELSSGISAFQKKIEPAESQLAAWEKEQLALEEKERGLQTLLRQDETAHNAAQLKLQRTEDALTRLRYDIDHDFGLVQLERTEEMDYQPPLPLEAVVEELPVIEEIPADLETEVKEMRARLSRVSNVNPEAPKEYDEAAERHQFLLTESADLEKAARDLQSVIKELDELMEGELRKTFDAVSKEFVVFFEMLFNGGTAKLVLTQPDDLNNTGIEIIARPPGKRPQSLALLSGGERSLSACALIFGILRTSPTPFCVLDEVDAALDEANVDRFRETIETLTQDTQFIIVTHNRRTLEAANAIYGITMGDDGISRMISLKLDGDQMVQADGEDERRQLQKVEEVVQM